jgi:hypothetical protein
MRVTLTRRESIESPDGVSMFIVSLAQALLELQHEVKIVVGWLKSRDTYERLLSPRLDLPVVEFDAHHVSKQYLALSPLHHLQPAALTSRRDRRRIIGNKPSQTRRITARSMS